jgi:formylglycine-generating enzyme required for sulfatase activity
MHPSENKRPLKVFLCHASADKLKVRELYRTLKRRGIQPWLDAENLIPGQNWEVEIPKALLSSDAIIVCLSPNSIDKEGYVQKEIKFALDKALEMPEGRIFLIPARLEECDLPFSLRQYQTVNLFDKDGYTKLMKALKLRATQLHRADVEASGQHPPLSTNQEEKPVPRSKESEERRPESKKTPRKLNLKIVIALIGAIATVCAALLLNVLPWKDWLTATSMPTVTPTSPVAATTSVPPAKVPTTVQTYTSPADEITDDFGVQMVLVPRGEFTMGSNNGSAEEKPVHIVYLDNYFIDKFEVTNASYKICVQAGVCNLPSQIVDYNNLVYDQHPVVFVSWNSALTYCEWRGARLPTEAEWEKAARGTDTRNYPWGEGINDTYANYDRYVAGGKTTPVGQYESGKSFYGAYDMAGNVWEWVADWYDVNFYSISPSSGPLGPRTGDQKVVRGGAFDRPESMVRTTVRAPFPQDETNSSVGFRCAKDANP